MKSLMCATAFTMGLFSISTAFSQQQLYEYQGFTVSTKTQKLEEQRKKDKYLMQIKMISEDQDLYYPASMMVNSKTKKKVVRNKTLGSVKVQNGTGLFTSKNIEGERSDYKTENGDVLYMFEKGKIYSDDDKFKVRSGDQPILTYEETKSLKPLNEYNLLIDGKMLNGTWTGDCVDGEILITYSDTGVKDVLFLRNGTTTHSWVRRSPQVFDKLDQSASLTFDKQSMGLIYFNKDGIQCRMKRDSE